MAPHDIRSRLRPFSPFRIFTTTGQTYDIRLPDLIMVGVNSVLIGFPASATDDVYERFTQLSLYHIVRIEPLEVQAKGNGEAKPGQ